MDSIRDLEFADAASCLKCGKERSAAKIAERMGLCSACDEVGFFLKINGLFEASPSDSTCSMVVRKELDTDRLPESQNRFWQEIESKTLKLLSSSTPYRRFTADDFHGLLRFLDEHVAVPPGLRGLWNKRDAVLMLSGDEIVGLLDAALAQPRTNVATSSVANTATAPNAVTNSKLEKPIKIPSDKAIQCYRLHIITGLKQKEIAMKVYGKASSQGQVSRDISTVNQFVVAGHVLPDLNWSREKIPSIDPAKIEKGRRLDKGRRYKDQPRD